MNHFTTHPRHQPPRFELPVVLPTPALRWSGDGIVLAVPSLLVYTTGAELLIMYRTRFATPVSTGSTRRVMEHLQDLRVNDVSVELLGGEHFEHGFDYRAWSPLAKDGAGNGGVSVGLIWPGVDDFATHEVAGVWEAASRATVLWED